MMRFLTALTRASSLVPTKSHAQVTLFSFQGLAPRRLRLAAVASACALTLAGCNVLTSSNSSGSSSLGPGGGDGINDAALGVAASPRVTDQQVNLPRGGGRAQVGRPYRIAGRLYTPREDPNYDRTGIASWYGDAFHGRLTANGEVYDMHTLSAAHPTLPLPSYVRVTNLSNNRSVMVRVNDRGPFAHDRIIDLSQRAADVLDMRNDGVARVRVQYESPAPLHGQDVAWLEASAQINGLPVNGGDPNLLLARAPVPAPTPVAAPNQIALVSTSQAQASAVAPAPPQQNQSFLQGLFGNGGQQAPVQQLPAPAIAAPATGDPIILAPPSPATQAFAPVAAPVQPSGLVTNAPIPSGSIPVATLGFMANDLETGFTQRNQSALVHQARVTSAHQTASRNALSAAENLALQSQAMTHLQQRQQLDRSAALVATAPSSSQATRVAEVQIGIFGDPSNVARLRTALSSFGEVVTTPVRSGSRTLTQVRLHAPIESTSDERALLRQLASQGYTDAYIANSAGG